MERSTVVISPFANERGKEWPLAHFRRLSFLLHFKLDFEVVIVGARHQRPRANELVRGFPTAIFRNECGRTSWDGVANLIASASCSIANNSGIAHLSARLGTTTVCVYGGAHDLTEWYPRGAHVVVVRKKTVCSPCMIPSNQCPYGVACLDGVLPEDVFYVVSRLVGPRRP